MMGLNKYVIDFVKKFKVIIGGNIGKNKLTLLIPLLRIIKFVLNIF